MTEPVSNQPDGEIRSDSLSDRLYDVGFFFVEAFAALEVTAVIVANARITESLRLPEELSSYIINSYLYPLFTVMLLIFIFSRRIKLAFNPFRFFVFGLGVFAGGNIVCSQAVVPFWFFAGRVIMAVGGAIAFAGQLWTLSVFHRWRIVRPLVWGEAGTAIGVVAGPIVGALFAQFSPEGWRDFFLLNAGLGVVTALFAALGLWRRQWAFEDHAPAAVQEGRGKYIIRIMTSWQVAVSILIVGSEYFFSDYLQAKAGKSPMFVGIMTVLASVGAVIGSIWAARLHGRLEKLPSRSAIGLLLSLGVLAVCLASGSFFVAGVPIFASGLCMGLASVSIYASIVESSDSAQFLSRSMIHLLGMQSGNAIGVQSVGLCEVWHLGVMPTAGFLAIIPLAITIGTLWYARSSCSVASQQ